MKRKKEAEQRPAEARLIDCERAIFISGELNDALVRYLTPQIIALRNGSEAPITVFIDSPGGSLASAKVIYELLKTPDQMGGICWVNTVVTGRACSGAADLLVSGDYIISYPNAYIHFHGVRIRTEEEEITAEVANSLEEKLLSMNKSTAVRVAKTVFERLLQNYFRIRPQLQLVRDAAVEQLDEFNILLGEGTIDVPAFAFYIFDKLTEPYKRVLIDCIRETSRMSLIAKELREVTDNRNQLPPIIRDVIKKVEEEKEGELTITEELTLLNMIVASKVRENSNWRLTTAEFEELKEDFAQLEAMLFFQDEFLDEMLKFSDWVMPPKDLKFFQKYTYEDTDDPRIRAKCDEIIDRACAKIQSLWSLSLSLCRSLSIGENPISPEDAWWLGLIDEVLGSPSLTRRPIEPDVKDSLLSRVSVSDFGRFVDYYDKSLQGRPRLGR